MPSMSKTTTPIEGSLILASNPISSMASITPSTVIFSGSNLTTASAITKLTLTDSSPLFGSTRPSMAATQVAQVIPSMSRLIVSLVTVAPARRQGADSSAHL